MKRIIKKIIPSFFITYYKNLNHYINKRNALGDKYTCIVCNTGLKYFNPLQDNSQKYGFKYTLDDAETLNYSSYSCPVCRSADRNRLYALYFKKRFENYSSDIKYKFIDFAPSPPLSNYIKQYPFLNYRTADMCMKDVDDIVDITDMKAYKDEIADIFLCSHILEHVSDDKKAIKELYRILKPGGWGILMVPILLPVDGVYEDPSHVTVEDRWKHYGLYDHVRVYGKQGFINRVRQESNFIIDQLDVNYFGLENFEKYGIHPRSVLYVVTKPS